MSSRNRERIGKINELSSFISENNRRIDKLLADLQWDRDTLKNTDVTMTTCPVDESHRVPSKSLDKHKELCSWIQQGYTREDYDNQLPSSHFYYKDSLSVVPVLIDKTLQSQILSSTPGSNVKDVAKTNHRAELDLTCQERVAIYDYVVDKAKKMNKKSVSVSQLEFDHAAMNQDSDAKSKSKSKLEILAELRDYKRRRQSYRGKNVHITRKSNTEVMREIIESHMQMLTDINKDNDKSRNSEEVGTSHRSRSSSPSQYGKSHDTSSCQSRYSKEHTYGESLRTDRDRHRVYKDRERDKRKSYGNEHKRNSNELEHKSKRYYTDDKEKDSPSSYASDKEDSSRNLYTSDVERTSRSSHRDADRKKYRHKRKHEHDDDDDKRHRRKHKKSRD